MNISYINSFCQQKTDTVVKKIAGLTKLARQLPPVSLALPVCQGKKAQVKMFCTDFLNAGTLKPQTYPLKELSFRGSFKQECNAGITQMPPIFALAMVTMVTQSTVYALFPVQGVKHTRGNTSLQYAPGDLRQTDNCAPVHTISMQKVHLWSLGFLLHNLYLYCLASPVSQNNAGTLKYSIPNNKFLHQKQKYCAYNQQSVLKIVEWDYNDILSKIEAFYQQAIFYTTFSLTQLHNILISHQNFFITLITTFHLVAANSNDPISTTIRKYQQGSVP